MAGNIFYLLRHAHLKVPLGQHKSYHCGFSLPIQLPSQPSHQALWSVPDSPDIKLNCRCVSEVWSADWLLPFGEASRTTNNRDFGGSRCLVLRREGRGVAVHCKIKSRGRRWGYCRLSTYGLPPDHTLTMCT